MTSPSGCQLQTPFLGNRRGPNEAKKRLMADSQKFALVPFLHSICFICILLIVQGTLQNTPSTSFHSNWWPAAWSHKPNHLGAKWPFSANSVKDKGKLRTVAAARAEIPVPASPTSGGRGYVSSSVVRRSRVSGAARAPAGVAAPSGRGKYRRPGSHSKTSTPSRRSCGQPAGPTCIVTHRAWPSMYYTVLTLMYPQIRYPFCRRRSRPNNSLGICQLTGRRKKQGPWQFPGQGCCRDNRWI